MKKEIRNFSRGDGGNVAVLFALLLPCLLGAVGLAVETGFWYSEKERIQLASDVAAYSAVVAYSGGEDVADAIAMGITEARASGFTGEDDDIRIQIPSPDTSLGPYSASAVIDQDVPLFFAKLFLNAGNLPVAVNAHASVDKKSASVCLLALNTTQSRSVVIAAGVKVELGNCVVASNSTANDALWLEGTTKLSAGCVSTPGKIGRNGGAAIVLSECTVADHLREPVSDYLAGTPFWGSPGVPSPATLADAAIDQGRYGPGMPGGARMKPGKYGKQVEIAGEVRFDPGIYYFTNGFRATSGGKILAQGGVTFFFEQSKGIDVAQSVVWDLKAPSPGPTKGMALMGNPADRSTGDVRFIGVLGNVDGAVYFPYRKVMLEDGPNLAKSCCTKVVADRIDIRGNGSIRVDCSLDASGPSGAKGIVGLVRAASAKDAG